MKKITLLVASIFLFGSVANASEIINLSDENRFPVDFRDADPIEFTERGITFYVFPDGQFDFNTTPSSGGMYYKPTRNSSVNKTFGTPSSLRIGNRGVRIEHDEMGRVRRVGNVFINYDRADRIKRIGNVYMSYNRFALAQIGGLKIIYNRRGMIIDFIGTVNGYRANHNNTHWNNDYNYSTENPYNDDDYYYYKADGTKAKIEEKEGK
ncbi:MAG: hypothetical protein V4548_07720 [Bacteroidota bacterium]